MAEQTKKETNKNKEKDKPIATKSSATQNTKSSANQKSATTATTGDPNKKFKDFLGILASFLTLAVAVVIFLNKIPKNLTKFQSYYSYFYIFALAGIIGVLGEKYTISFFGFILPLLMAGSTILIKLKPKQFPIEDIWNEYSVMVLISAAFLLFLYMLSLKELFCFL